MTTGTFSAPTWSPDGRHIAVVETRVGGDSGRLLIVDARSRRGRAAHGISAEPPVGFAWSPDSSQLLVTARGGTVGCTSLWLVRLADAAGRLLRRC